MDKLSKHTAMVGKTMDTLDKTTAVVISHLDDVTVTYFFNTVIGS